MSIYEALAAVMADVDHVAKRDRNEAQKFLFRGIDAVINAVGPVLRKYKVIVVPSVESVDYATIAARSGGSLTSCRVIVTYTFHAEDGSSLATKVAAEAFDSGDKATPKAMSVAFRTALLQSLALPTDDPDPDAESHQVGAPATRQSATPGAGTRRMSRPNKLPRNVSAALHAALRDAGKGDREHGLAYIRQVVGRDDIDSTDDLTHVEVTKVIDATKAPGQPDADEQQMILNAERDEVGVA
jgi:hypothetical protein